MSVPDHSQSSADEEGEGVEDENQYEDDGFIDDRSFDEYDDKSRDQKRKKRKRRPEGDEQLDEEDLALLNDNKKGSNKRKRIKKNREKLKEEETSQRYDDEVSERDEQFENEMIEEDQKKQKQMSLFKNIFDSSDDEEDKAEMKEEMEKELTIRDTSAMGRFRDSSWRKEITEINIPERIYTRLKDRLNPTEQELELEARWIFKYKKHWKGFNDGEERMIHSVQNVLTHFRKNHFDIPFIATYRYYLFQHELQRSDFYDIYELDLEWDNFIKTKKSLIKKVKGVIDVVPGKVEIESCVEN